ncbi:MAG: thrombospondin type 3 repeat-containing protein, partial [Myxococcota bacterium]
IGLSVVLAGLLSCGVELERVDGAMQLWVTGLDGNADTGTVRIGFEGTVSEFDTPLAQPAFIASVPAGEVTVFTRVGDRRTNRVSVEVFEGEVARVAVQLLDDLEQDDDGDSIPARRDNCPFDPNPDQRDSDWDGFGDACDRCQSRSDPTQDDMDGDGIGDRCDPDIDGDGVLNVADECPFDASGNADVDFDGVCDSSDNCLLARNENQRDCDGDGIGDACDTDIDADSIPNSTDICPFAFDPDQRDSDLDGLGDACRQDPLQCVPGGAP